MAKTRKENGEVREEPTATNLAPVESSNVATLEESDYQDGFYEFTVTDPDNVFPASIVLPLAETVNRRTGKPQFYAFEVKRRETVLRYKCIAEGCPTKGGHEWLPEPMLRCAELVKTVPSESKWMERWAKSQMCPACAKIGRNVKGIQKKVGGNFPPVEVRQVQWLTAAERTKLDEVLDPERKPRAQFDTIKLNDRESIEVKLADVDGPLIRKIKDKHGIAKYHKLGPMISARYIGTEYDPAQASIDPSLAAQLVKINRLEDEALRINDQIEKAETVEEKERLLKLWSEVARKKKDLTASYVQKITPTAKPA